jgi:hypothetical protein
MNGAPFIELAPGANGGVQPPSIVSASDGEVVGLAAPGALVRLFAAPAPGAIASFAGAARADQGGVWALPAVASVGEAVAATQTGTTGTSALSAPVTATHAGGSAPPSAAISGPSGTIFTASPMFALSSSDPAATFLCRLDSAPYAACGASEALAALSEGPHTLSVRAVDPAGLGAELSNAFEVDLAPLGTIVSGPPRYGNRSYAVFRFTVQPGAVKTECALDRRSYGICSARFASGYLLDGRHLFHVRTTDAAAESVVLDTVFTVDTLPPSVALGSTRIRASSSGSATIAVYCPPSEPGGCWGSVRLGTVPARRSHSYTAIGTATWQTGPNTSSPVVIGVPAWAVARGLRGGGLPIDVVVSARDHAGNVKVIRRRGTLLAAANAV